MGRLNLTILIGVRRRLKCRFMWLAILFIRFVVMLCGRRLIIVLIRLICMMIKSGLKFGIVVILWRLFVFMVRLIRLVIHWLVLFRLRLLFLTRLLVFMMTIVSMIRNVLMFRFRLR